MTSHYELYEVLRDISCTIFVLLIFISLNWAYYYSCHSLVSWWRFATKICLTKDLASKSWQRLGFFLCQTFSKPNVWCCQVLEANHGNQKGKNLACLDFVSQNLAINQSGPKFSCTNTIYSYLIKFVLQRIHILELFIIW